MKSEGSGESFATSMFRSDEYSKPLHRLHPFQLHLGHSPWPLPPLTSLSVTSVEEETADSLIFCLHKDLCKAKDNLIAACISQAMQANKMRGDEPCFKVSDFVMLSTANRCHKYQQRWDGQTAKLMPHFNGKYKVISAHPEASVYSIDMPNAPL